MVEAGVFRDSRVELIDGVIYDMTPQNSWHATGVRKAQKALEDVFSAGYDVRSQMPLDLGFKSMPEPDVSVVPGDPDDYTASHPTTALLVVEVTDSSLHHDRKRKKDLYARAGIPDYWILNLPLDAVEAFRDPQGGLYRTKLGFRRGERISPVSRPDLSIAVEDLLPKRP